jgi:NAD-dependent deacetylase
MLPDTVIQRLRDARHVALFTGAGMSAESGVPTFRDRFEGLWAKVDPQEVATPWAFRANPQFVWDWHVHLAEKVRAARPNPGHEAIARLRTLVERVSVITQNIDNLHQNAGSLPVMELHGNLFRLKSFVDEAEAFADGREPAICPVCDGYANWDECDPYAGKEDLAGITLRAGTVPCCPGCRALLRPDIVWFGEMLDPGTLRRAIDAAETCDAMICVGSSLEVEPAASLPYLAHQRGALVIEINPIPTALAARADASIAGSAATVLPELLRRVWGNRGDPA